MKLLITGGHVTPALAIIDELRAQKKDVSIIFVGRQYTYESDKEYSMEYKEVQLRSIPFINLSAGRFARVLSLQSILHFLKIPSGFFKAYRILKKERPDIILSFGGYVALPIALIATLLKIVVLTHEQTIHPGIANRIIAHCADVIFVSFEQSKAFFKGREVIVSGNPVRASIMKVEQPKWAIKKDKRVIYITGGSLGSHSINILIEKIIPALLNDYIVIHQTGNVQEYGDYQRLITLRNSLLPELQDHYVIRQHVLSDEIGYVYSVSDLILGRAGANTFFEIVALKKPVLFIPLPWASYNEQNQQASLAKAWGIAEVFDQNKSSDELLTLIRKMMHNTNVYSSHFEKIPNYATEATNIIIQKLLSYSQK